jgi:hypothetical protein
MMYAKNFLKLKLRISPLQVQNPCENETTMPEPEPTTTTECTPTTKEVHRAVTIAVDITT